jgi:lipopolysaccharide biosynthesis glycosyltransferase
MTTINKKNLIVTLADANFIDQAKQLFSSVYFKAGWTGDYLLLASDISEADLTWFKEKGILIYDCPLLFDKPVGSRNYPPVVLSKFYLFKEYFKQWQKIIFLDADIIVRAPFEEILTVDNFGAVRTTFALRDEFVWESWSDVKKVKSAYRLNGPAFNSGFFIFNTDLITNKTFDDLFSLHQRFEGVSVHGEEATLNLFFYKNWQELPIVYNSMPFFMDKYYRLSSSRLLAVVIHFVNSLKPWDKNSPYYQEWQENLQAADLINIKQPVSPVSKIDAKELKKYLRFIKLINKKKIWETPLLLLDSQLGQLGLFIKEKNPKLYKIISLKKHD